MSQPRIGRPPIGPEVKAHVPQWLIDDMDAEAAATGQTRSEVIRARLEHHRTDTTTTFNINANDTIDDGGVDQ